MPSFWASNFFFLAIFLNFTFIGEPLLTCKIVKKIRWFTYVLTGIIVLYSWKDFDFGDYFTIFIFLYIYFCIQISM